MESESKQNSQTVFETARGREWGICQSYEGKKIKRKKYPSWRSFSILGIGYYLGRDPLQPNHTQPMEIGT